MNTLTPLGSRPYQTLPTAQQTDGRQSRTNSVSSTDGNKEVSLSSKGLDMQQRVAQLGNSTVDLAQNLLGSFAQSLFGDAAEGATFSFDSVTLESSASFAAGVMQSQGPDGTTSAAMLSMSESSHFLGKGTITTADGRKFDFEIEIQYEASLQAGAASSVPSRRQDLADKNPAMPLPTVEFPDIDFPGSLADLFKLMERNHEMSVKQRSDDGKETADLGTLSMRLMKLVNSESMLDTYLPSKAKEVANAYGALPGTAARPAPDAPAVGAPAEPASGKPAPSQASEAPTPAPAAAPAPAPAADAAKTGQGYDGGPAPRE